MPGDGHQVGDLLTHQGRPVRVINPAGCGGTPICKYRQCVEVVYTDDKDRARPCGTHAFYTEGDQ